MWTIVLTVALLCCSSEGSVTCRNQNNDEVDWYIIYKVPRLQREGFTGLEYLYVDPAGQEPMQAINDPNGVIANTLRPLLMPIRKMPEKFGFISYSDQPPGCSANPRFGHGKGVVMVDKTSTEAPGVWLLHSTPQFPFRRDQNNFWPPNGEKHAQTFMCVTFKYNQFASIGKHLQYIGAFPFEYYIPSDFHQELIDATNWVQVTPPKPSQPLKSRGGQEFYSFAKQKSEDPEVGDLYVTIAKEVHSNLKAQTWGCQKDCDVSYCKKNQYQVLNIIAVTGWDTTNDHSKWCVATDNNLPWICIADVNRAKTQYKRGGGALCFKKDQTKDIFQNLIEKFESCARDRTMGTLVDTSMCDTVLPVEQEVCRGGNLYQGWKEGGEGFPAESPSH